MMKWEAEEKGYTCNDCYLAMQNCHDKSICCEDETGLCDWFEELPREGESHDGRVEAVSILRNKTKDKKEH